MPLLMYCIMNGSAPRADPGVGLGELEISRLEISGIAALYSESSSADVWLRAPLKHSALQFHRVLLRLFESAAIIPFRFPAILEDYNSLTTHIDAQGGRYKSLLQKLVNKAQMDIRISVAGSHPQARSGTEFLQQRKGRQECLESLAASIHVLVKNLSGEWRVRPVADGLRSFALLDRSIIASFKEKLATIQFPTAFYVRVNGPWPVTEFLEELSGA